MPINVAIFLSLCFVSHSCSSGSPVFCVGGLYADITLSLGRLPCGIVMSSAVRSGDLLGRKVISHDGMRFVT